MSTTQVNSIKLCWSSDEEQEEMEIDQGPATTQDRFVSSKPEEQELCFQDMRMPESRIRQASARLNEFISEDISKLNRFPSFQSSITRTSTLSISPEPTSKVTSQASQISIDDKQETATWAR